MAKVTIEDISRATGLSRGTVSRALNDRPDISTPTKQRVLEACRKLKYVPSHAARSLATGRSYAVAVVVDDLASAFAAAYLRGVMARAERARYIVQVVELGDDPRLAGERLRTLSDERIDGALIAAPVAAAQVGVVRQALAARTLAACWALPGISCDVFTPDQLEAGRLVARHLLRDGARKVLYVHVAGVPVAAQRLAGFIEIASGGGLDLERTIVEVPAARPEGVAAVSDLETRLAQVEAVAATDDFLAIELMLLAFRAGRTPGRDLAILGQGNEPIGTRIHPSLSSVDFSGEEIGRRTMEVVVQRLEGARRDTPQTVRVAPRLVLRDSA